MLVFSCRIRSHLSCFHVIPCKLQSKLGPFCPKKWRRFQSEVCASAAEVRVQIPQIFSLSFTCIILDPGLSREVTLFLFELELNFYVPWFRLCCWIPPQFRHVHAMLLVFQCIHVQFGCFPLRSYIFFFPFHKNLSTCFKNARIRQDGTIFLSENAYIAFTCWSIHINQGFSLFKGKKCLLFCS